MKAEQEKVDLQQQLNFALQSELKARRYMDDLVDVLKSALLQERERNNDRHS